MKLSLKLKYAGIQCISPYVYRGIHEGFREERTPVQRRGDVARRQLHAS